MEVMSNTKLIKQQDPIWKRLFVNRIYMAVLLIMAIFAIYSYISALHNNLTAEMAYLILFWTFIILVNGIGLLTSNRYWRRIGQRRLTILRGEQDTQSFLANYQIRPEERALEIPVRLRLVWNRTILIAIAALAGVLVIVLSAIGIIMALQKSPAFEPFLFITVIILASLLLTILLLYFIRVHYQFQMIKVTEEGIETRYMRQKRFLRWEDARLFATYGAQGINKSPFLATYELSNEQVVVRWSQQAATGIFLKVEDSTGKSQDWNGLVSRVNAYVAARTNLPLLDLSDEQQASRKRHTRKAVQQYQQQHQQPSPYNMASSPATVKIAQNDLVMRRLSLRNGTGASMTVLGAFGLGAILIGCYGIFWNPFATHISILDTAFPRLMLGSGILLLLSALLFLWVILVVTKSQARIQAKRQQAILHPERFHATEQPIPSAEQPQPASIKLERRKKSFFLLSFIEGFILSFIIAILLIPPASKTVLSILITVVATGCLSLLGSLIIFPRTNQASRTYIEVSTEGISTRTGTMESHMRWQDAHLFARYKPQGLLKKHTRTWLYELASEQTIVRWQWPRSQRRMTTTNPRMTQEEYDHWLDQLQRYVMARTDLPLLDLDAPLNQ